MALNDVTFGDKAPKIVNLVIELQRNSRNKYEFDKDSGVMMLDRVNATQLGYPADYGYIPQTLCEDGDPLDALLIIDESVLPTVVVPAKAIGVLYMVDDGEKDEKLICVASDDVTKSHIQSVDDLGDNFKKVIEHFYSHYKDWKNDWKGISVSFNGWGNAEDAQMVIQQAIDRYKDS
jgi:inorganic pyrophosphatase